MCFNFECADIKRDLAKADEMCRKVRLAVANVERNRVKFSHIDERELGSRKAFCDRLEASINSMKIEYNSRETQGKRESDARKELASRMAKETDSAARGMNSYTKANADYMKDQSQQQATIRREQDKTLDKMSSGLDTLKEMAVTIDAELKDQEKIIDDVDKSVDEAQVRPIFAIEDRRWHRQPAGHTHGRAHSSRGWGAFITRALMLGDVITVGDVNGYCSCTGWRSSRASNMTSSDWCPSISSP